MADRVNAENAENVKTRDGLQFCCRSKRHKKVAAEVKRKIEVRRGRLIHLEKELSEQEAKVEDWSNRRATENASRRDSIWKASAIAHRDALKERIAETKREIEVLESNEVAIGAEDTSANPVRSAGDFPANEKIRNLAAGAREWAVKYGVKDFVTAVALDNGETVEVVHLHKARHAETKMENGEWPAFFSTRDLTDEGAAEKRIRLKNLLACATPDMKPLVSLLLTEGMLHAVILEAMSMRGAILPPNDNPTVLERGLEKLKNLLVVDSSVYWENLEKK